MPSRRARKRAKLNRHLQKTRARQQQPAAVAGLAADLFSTGGSAAGLARMLAMPATPTPEPAAVVAPVAETVTPAPAPVAVAATPTVDEPTTAPVEVETTPAATVAPVAAPVAPSTPTGPARRRLPDFGRRGALGLARAGLAALEVLDRLGPDADPAAVTAEDWETLAGWPGWGPLAPALSRFQNDGAWSDIAARLRWLLPSDRFDDAQQATPNAFYTSPEIARAVWTMAAGLGFPGGPVLEPGCGAGVFMSEAPDNLARPVSMVGVERDPTTAAIARLLWPTAEVRTGALEQVPLLAEGYALAVGNVPFADVSPYDPDAPRGLSLHNYMIWRALQAVHPGGLVAVITSRWTLDAESGHQRAELARLADLVGAIRLPSGAFSGQGTDVIADILVLRRRARDADQAGTHWLQTVPVAGLATPINQYFAGRPDRVLGRMGTVSGQYGAPTLTVRYDGADFAADLAEAAALVADAGRTGGLNWTAPAGPADPAAGIILQDAEGRKAGSFHVISGAVCQVTDRGQLTPVSRGGAELRALIGLRDAAVALLDAEADHDRPDSSLDGPREALNASYDAYRRKYGALNRCTIVDGPEDPETGLPTRSRRRPQMGGFRADPDYVTVLALENYDDDTGNADKAEIFRRRVNRAPVRRERADNPAEAVALCLDELGTIQLGRIGELLDVDEAAALATLDTLVYHDPTADRWVPADEYLSGDVRDKLEQARGAADRDPAAYARNVAALETVQPVELGPAEIRVKLGAPFIPPSDVEAFLQELLGGRPRVYHEPVTATWEVKVQSWYKDTPAAAAQWGTARVHAYRLAEQALNGQIPTVYDEIKNFDGSSSKVKNAADTMLAQQRQRALNDRFGQWIWEDQARTDRLCADYNQRYNSTVVRRFDGSHLTFPGMTDGVTLWAHQRDIVYRIVSTEAALCGHPVGAGKTNSMFASAMTLRRLGLASKPLITVPNHLLEQVARDGKRLYPNANVLMVTKDDMSKERRKLFAARCATGDWDVVVMTHSAFTALPVDPTVEARWLRVQIRRFKEAEAAAEDAGGGRTVKAAAKMADRMQARLAHLLDHKTDDGVTFQQLGVDYLMVDEAHYFKNLGVFTRTEGFSMAASKRAADLAMKLWFLRDQDPGGRFGALFTGTPVSNSLAELYVLQTYLQPDRLEAMGVGQFDPWARLFVEFEARVEVAPDGGSFRLHTRPAKFVNVPELRTMLGHVADIRDKRTLGLQGPEVDAQTIVIPPSPELVEYVQALVARSDAIRNGQVEPEEDNMLSVCTDGRRAALDLELVGVRTDDPGKVGDVVAQAARVYHETASNQYPGSDVPGALQIVFCDQGTPNAESRQTYGKIRAGLIAAGVPAEGIRFIHDAKTDTAKAGLFSDCRTGKVAVLLGSTDKLGVGTNVQARNVAIHHVDAPWRPADVEQRDGRGDRPGNHNPTLRVFRYVTERSFDAYMWQALERKAKFISQILTGDLTVREVEDVGDGVLSYTEIKALATGQPLLMELAEIQAELIKLRSLATGHTRDQGTMKRKAGDLRDRANGAEAHAGALERVAANATDNETAALAVSGGEVLTERAEIGHALAVAAHRSIEHGTRRVAGQWRGLPVDIQAEKSAFGGVRIRVEVRAGWETAGFNAEESWTREGQTWRFADALARFVDNAADEAAELRHKAEGMRGDAEDADQYAARPFEDADAIAAARARHDAIEDQLREAAAKDHEARNGAAIAA